MKKIVLGIIAALGTICSIVLLLNKLNTFAIVTITLTVILLIYLITNALETKSPEYIYNKTVKDLLKTYETILVDVNKLPELEVKNIINTSSFEKMVDVQYELKKPILYKKCLTTCSFILLDTETAYVYILRVNEDVLSPLDPIIESIEINNKKRRKEKKLLDDIDKTTIIKLDDSKEYKVSPVRKKDLSKTNEIKVEIEELEEEII